MFKRDLVPSSFPTEVLSLIASNDSKWIVTASLDGTIIVWDAERGTLVQEWVPHQGSVVNDLAFSPDSGRLLSAGSGKAGERLIVWEASNGFRRVAALEDHTGNVLTCAWSPDGSLIASGSDDGTVRVWDAQTFQQCDLLKDTGSGTMSFLDPGPTSLQFSPDGSFLAWICKSPERCTTWKPLTGEQPKVLQLLRRDQDVAIHSFSFGPDSKRIATAHGGGYWDESLEPRPEDYVVKIWDVTSGATLAVLTGHSDPADVWDVSFSPDGRSLLSALENGTTKVWDTNSWEEIASLEEGNKSPIWRARFSPDGKYIATVPSDRPMQLWRTGDASRVAVFTEHTTTVRHIVFTADSQFLASVDKEGIVHSRRISGFAS